MFMILSVLATIPQKMGVRTTIPYGYSSSKGSIYGAIFSRDEYGSFLELCFALLGF